MSALMAPPERGSVDAHALRAARVPGLAAVEYFCARLFFLYREFMSFQCEYTHEKAEGSAVMVK